MTGYADSIILYVVCFLGCAALAGAAQIYSRRVKPAVLAPSVTQYSRPNRVFWILSLLIPLLLASFRWQTGTDYPTYVSLYYSLNSIGDLPSFINHLSVTEPSFILLNFFSKALFSSYLPVFALSALFTLSFFYRAIEDYNEQSSVMLAVLVFLCLLYGATFNIMRQMIAVAITFYASRHMFQGRFGAAALWLLLAVSFHYTALVVLPFWIFRKRNRPHNIARMALFSLLVFIIFGLLFFRRFFEGLPLLNTLAVNTAEGAYLSYGLLILRLPIIVPVLLFRRRLVEHDERNYFWIFMTVFELAFSHLGYVYDVFNRLALYFAVSWMVLLPSLVRCMRTRRAQYGMGAYVAAVIAGLWIYNAVIKNYGDVLPYKSIFDAYFAGLL